MNRAATRRACLQAFFAGATSLSAVACGDVFTQPAASGDGGGDATTASSGSDSATSSDATGSASSASGGGGDASNATTGSGGSACDHGEDADFDGDGVTIIDGDCNDCDQGVSPKAFDFPENDVDEDCSGAVDDALPACDEALAIESLDPKDGARAIGLCQDAGGFGLVDATYVMADGASFGALDPLGLGHGLLPDYGPNVHPQEGGALLALSTGTARRATDLGYVSVDGFSKGYTSGAPAGYPKPWPACPGATPGSPRDSVALEVSVKVPSNARGIRFAFDFYARDFPAPLCNKYNDFFVAHLSPAPPGLLDGNVSFDAQGNAISVNASVLRVCTPQVAGGQNFACMLGASQLTGTGFDEHAGSSAASGWMQSTAPVTPESTITLRFAVWDSGDGSFDSTVLIDDFAFLADDAPVSTSIIDSPL